MSGIKVNFFLIPGKILPAKANKVFVILNSTLSRKENESHLQNIYNL